MARTPIADLVRLELEIGKLMMQEKADGRGFPPYRIAKLLDDGHWHIQDHDSPIPPPGYLIIATSPIKEGATE